MEGRESFRGLKDWSGTFQAAQRSFALQRGTVWHGNSAWKGSGFRHKIGTCTSSHGGSEPAVEVKGHNLALWKRSEMLRKAAFRRTMKCRNTPRLELLCFQFQPAAVLRWNPALKVTKTENSSINEEFSKK